MLYVCLSVQLNSLQIYICIFLQVGFGNVAAETDNEKVFTICMMIIAGAVSYIPLPLSNTTRPTR